MMYTVFFICIFFLSGCSEQSATRVQPFMQELGMLENETIISGVMQELATGHSFDQYTNTASITLFSQGDKTFHTYESRISLSRSLYKLGGSLQKVMNDMGVDDIHVSVYGDWQVMDHNYIHGVHGLQLNYGSGVLVYPPSYAVETNRSYEKTKQKMYEEFLSIYTVECKKVGCELLYAPTKHIAKRVQEESIREYYRGKILQDISPVSIEKLETMFAAGTQRILDNIDGKFIYVYNPSSGIYSKNNNMIRQFMASRLLAELAHDDKSVQEKHKANVQYILRTRYQEDGPYGYVRYNNKSKLGALALLLRTLVESPFVGEYTKEIEQLTTTILSLQDDQGYFVPWYIEPSYAYDADYLMTFYSGEAILALVELYLWNGSQRVLDAAVLAQDAYLERYVDEIDQWYYPAYVPWHTMSLYKLYEITGNQRYADAIFVLNDKLIDEMLVMESDIPDILGRFYNPEFPEYGTPHSASDGVYAEGLVYAYMLAHEVGGIERQEKYRTAIDLAVYNLQQLQYTPDETYFLVYPERVVGALRFRADDNRIRIDTTQHALDALLILKEALSLYK